MTFNIYHNVNSPEFVITQAPNVTFTINHLVVAPNGLPSGGTTGQVAAKKSNSNYDVEWVDQIGIESVTSTDNHIVVDNTDQKNPSLSFQLVDNENLLTDDQLAKLENAIEDAPDDGTQYGRQSKAWTAIGAASVTKENVGAAVDSFDVSTPTDADYIILGGKKKTLISALKTLFKTANDLLYEPIITKLTAFNKNFGTTAGTVLEGRTFGSAANNNTTDFATANHDHTGDDLVPDSVTTDTLTLNGIDHNGNAITVPITFSQENGVPEVSLPNGITGQMFQEVWFEGKATEAISNMDVCQFAGVQGNHILIKKAIQSDVAINPQLIMGIATQNIALNAFGMVTYFGKVNDVYTTGFALSDLLYFDSSGSTAGNLVNVAPVAPNRKILMAAVIKLATGASENGIIMVRPTFGVKLADLDDVDGGDTTILDTDEILKKDTAGLWKKVTWANVKVLLTSVFIPKTQNQLTKEPTGFTEPSLVVVTGNGDRTISLSGTVAAYYRGEVMPTLINGYTSGQHGTDTAKQYYLSYDGTSIAWRDTLWTFDHIQIAIAKYNITNSQWKYYRECHGLMNWQTHQELHETIGTYKSGGGLIPSASYVLLSTTAADRRPNIDQTIIKDEDLPTTLAALTSKLYTQFSLTGAGVESNVLSAADIVPLLALNPYYNSFATPNWGQTLMPTNSVASVWIYAQPMANDAISQQYRYIFVQPQWVTQATSQSAGAILIAVNTEKLRLPSELNLNGLLSNEIVAIGRIVIAYTSANWSLRDVSILSGNKYSQIASPTLSIIASNVTETNYGNVQSAIDALKVLQITPITLTQANWTLVSGLYEYDYANVLITATKFVDVIPDNATISITKAAELLPTNVSSAGSVKLYSKNAPTGDIVITINIYE